MKKIYILDAVNYLFRAYYAIGPMTSPKGDSTSALFGFIRSIQKLIRDFAPTHLVCVFDGPDNKKSRHAVYAEYKMHRKGAPEDLLPQFEWASEYCKLANIPFLCVEGVEADDTIASVALWAEKQGAESFLCSSDKDLMQLVNEHIFMLHLHKQNLLIDSQKVKELYGVRPDQMLDLLAMMGDSSDNIPGIKGFGPKTAASLLEEFGSLDYILDHPEKVKGEKKQKLLQEQADIALMSRELATLDTKVPIPLSKTFYELKAPDLERVIPFFQEMGFHSLLKEFKETEVPAPQTQSKAALHPKKKEYVLVQTREEMDLLFKELLKEEEIGLDTETTDLSPFLAHLVGIGFSCRPAQAWYIPLNGPMPKKEVLSSLQSFFSSSKAHFFGHHLKFDLHILDSYGMKLNNIGFDTLLASYVLDPQKRRHNLDDLCLEKFAHVKISFESLVGKGKHQISMNDVPLENIQEYCCEDVDYTCRLKELFEKELKKRKLSHVFEDLEMPLLPVLVKMEKKGVFLDVKELRKVGVSLNRDLDRVKKDIFSLAKEEFNLNSPKQLSHVLYEKLAIPSKSSSTSADVLESLKEHHPIIEPLLEYRTLEKLRSTYVEALPQSLNPVTGRIHCTFNQSVTATGRLSSQNPNLQNIPTDSSIRACFKPENGSVFLGADYSQIELRLLAHFSEDPELLKAFREGRDIHRHTASLIFQVKEKEVTPEMRKLAKTVNFGILYGLSAFGLSKQLHLPQKEAAHFIQTYFSQYSSVGIYLEECKDRARKLGYSQTLTGRQRPILEIHNKNPMIRSAAERLAVNTPLQGTAADMIKIAMIEIDKEIQNKGLKGEMILQIHDELIFEIPKDEISSFESLVKKNMEHVFDLKVPIEVDIAVGESWAEC